MLCGVTRVGLVAKGLLIRGDLDLELVLMCREKPTKLLLFTISANLPLQIQVLVSTRLQHRFSFHPQYLSGQFFLMDAPVAEVFLSYFHDEESYRMKCSLQQLHTVEM